MSLCIASSLKSFPCSTARPGAGCNGQRLSERPKHLQSIHAALPIRSFSFRELIHGRPTLTAIHSSKEQRDDTGIRSVCG